MTADILSLEEAALYLRMVKRDDRGNSVPDTARLVRISTGPRPKVASIKEGNLRTYRLASLEAYVEANETAAAPANPWGMNDASAKRVRRAG